MENKLIFKIKKENQGLKIRDYLTKKENLSNRFCRSYAMSKNLFVNDKVVKLNYLLKENDIIKINLNKKEEQNIEGEKMDLDIIFEDDDIIVLNKPPFMVVHPTKSHPNKTLSNGLIYYFRSKGEDTIVRLVNRLDMNTSGLILIAKNQFSHMALQRDMKKESFKKEYLAITHNELKEEHGTINLPIYHDGESIKRVVDLKGQESITYYNVVDRYKNGQLVHLQLETGRTHQIRIHLMSLECPIYGDSLYGKEDAEFIKRQALHAYKLSIPHPRDGRIINFKCDLPEDMNQLIEKLK